MSELEPPAPFGTDETPAPSPAQSRAIEIKDNSEVAKVLARSQAVGPSVRQQTQSETLNLALLHQSLGGANPFNVRRIPYSILRDMASDAIISYAFYYTVNPLINAEFSVQSEDSQLAAAVDAAFRPINPEMVMNCAQSLYYGCSPQVKEWEYGPLEAKYRDRHSSEPEKDLEVWPSKNVDVLMPKVPVALAPENCIPKWDENGGFDGFLYSTVPIPNPMLLGLSGQYGPSTLQGYQIPKEFALWVINEKEENFGNIFGSPRTKRAYRFWWSYWYRWALADRAFENKVDPAKIVYYPTETVDGLDSNGPENSNAVSLRAKAIRAGMDAKSGSIVALPGDFMEGPDGKLMSERQWKIEYLTGGENFEALERTFTYIDIQKMRAMMAPEQAFLDSNVTGQGSSQRYVATQMGEIYRESQQYLIDSYDQYKNKYMVPQFVAANFPDKINVPVKIKTGGLGAANDELIKQIITIIGQKNPRDLPVNLRQLLSAEGIPLLTKAEQDASFKKTIEEAKAKGPEVAPPHKKEGTEGYNAGVEKTETGEHVYINGPGQINLSSANDFLSALPNIPTYENPSVRSAAMRLRKLMLDRYKNQIKTFAGRLKDKITMQLADEESKHKHGAGAAKLAAEAAVASWLAEQSKDRLQLAQKMQEILSKIVTASGRGALKQANLDQGVYSPQTLDPWIKSFTEESLDSIDHTLREEFISFLTDELQNDSDTDHLAEAFEEHFAETPQTHADRISRTQTGEAYNQGMIQAAEDAGISQVLAHDASDGTNTATDNFCLQRNGKVLSPREAKLQKQAHPNCTLYFTYLTTENLSLEIIDQIPAHLEIQDDDTPGAYDPKTETLYVKSNFADGATNWMLTLGKRLSF